MARIDSPASVEAATGEERLDVLDSFRGIAILMVAIFHFTVACTAPLDHGPAWPHGHVPAGSVFNSFAPFYYGWIGVRLFFFISGFVILMTLERCRSVLDFAARRFARIYPPMFFIATATALLVGVAGPADWRQGLGSWIASVLILDPKIIGAVTHRPDLTWVDGSYWSLWVEVRFYVIAGLLYRLSGRWFALSLGSICLAVSVAIKLAGATLSDPGAKLGVAGKIANAFVFPEFLPYFAVGALGYVIFMRRALVASYVLFGLLLLSILLQTAFEPAREPALGSVLAHVIVISLFCAFVFRAPGVKLLAWEPMIIVGRSSYSFYLLHESLGIMLLMLLTSLGIWVGLAVPLTILIFVLLAIIVFYTLELPAKSWVHSHTRASVKFIDVRAPWSRYQPVHQRIAAASSESP